MMNKVVSNLFSGSSPEAEETDVDLKRPLEDNNFLDNSNIN